MFWLKEKLISILNRLGFDFMSSSTFPEKFIQLLKDKGIHSECELKNHPDTCCSNITTKVFDFDKTKELFYKEIGLSSSCYCGSVDALYLSKDKSKLFLIEMKKKNSSKSIGEYISDYFKADKVPKQFIESIMLMLSIGGYYRLESKFYNYVLDSSKTRMKAIFLSNCTDRELNILTIASLHERTFDYTKVITGKVGIYNCQSIQNFFNNN